MIGELFFIRDGIKGARRCCKTEKQFKIFCKNSVTWLLPKRIFAETQNTGNQRKKMTGIICFVCSF